MTASDDIVLITGAARGIGLACVQLAISQGWHVVAHCRKPSKTLQLIAAEVSKQVAIVTCDLADIDARKTLWIEASKPFGPPTALINNAGIMPSTPPDMSDSTWDRDWAAVLSVNVGAVADLCRSAIQDWQLRSSGGRIVSIASRAAFRGDNPDALHYAASKGAVVSLMRSLARAYSGAGIYSFIIAPGWVDTDMAAVARDPANAHMLKEIPKGGMASPESIAAMALFLLSGAVDDATGGTFDMNGASYIR